MLSIEKCRELIPHSNVLADKQIEEVRDNLFGLAELALEKYFEEVQ
ncbi:MAG: hypothetical protein WDN67_01920 [Candidatus Moraniibacteriota bacterium]